ncbi:hypothetical protein [Salinibius halmophilus]|uniref:hypothetical protein n=1 Tax=Salinibius halmophilus TaxID=1853216 RepID=UPI0013142830|nr:hypothetical protein [Salinibius halmophilus]
MLAMLATMAFNHGIYGFIAVLLLEVMIPGSFSRSLRSIKVKERKLIVAGSDVVHFDSLRKLEVLPYRPATWLQRQVCKAHPGNFELMLTSNQNERYLLDLSLFSYDDRIEVVELIRARSPYLTMVLPQDNLQPQ